MKRKNPEDFTTLLKSGLSSSNQDAIDKAMKQLREERGQDVAEALLAKLLLDKLILT